MKKQDDLLTNKEQYSIKDYINIPIKVCPVITILIIINKIIIAILPIVSVYATAAFVNSLVNHENINIISVLIPFLVLCFIVGYNNLSHTIILNYINPRYDIAIEEKLKWRMLEKRTKLKYEYIEDAESWDLIHRVCSNVLGSFAFGMNTVLDIIEISIRLVSMLLLISSEVWWVGIIVTLVFIPFIKISVSSGKKVYETKRNTEQNERKCEYYEDVLTSREYANERYLFGYEEKIRKKWSDLYKKTKSEQLKVELSRYIKMKLSNFLTLIVTSITLTVLLISVVRGDLAVGMYIGFATNIFSLVNTISWRAGNAVKNLILSKEYIKDFNVFCNMQEEEGVLSSPSKGKCLKVEKIEFVDVSFAYPNSNKLVLEGFNLTLYGNEQYAFVGENGAGKSTVVKLLLGFYKNYSGAIFVNGKELKEYKAKEIKELFAVGFQEFYHYPISILENIVLGLEDETVNSRLAEVINSVELNNVVENFEDGLNTNLGKIYDESNELSGGEWQKLMLARTLYRETPVLILDEPTASLDPTIENKIYEMFSKFVEDKMSIIITHRLGAVQCAKKIIVIDGGKVIEQGTHQQLMNENGKYSNMYNEQAKWYRAGEEI